MSTDDEYFEHLIPTLSPEHLSALPAKFRELAEDRTAAHREGIPALRRLLPVALRDTGQSRVIARFLLGLYNGNRFPFDLTDLRMIDTALFEDCVRVLRMDHNPEREVHCYFDDGDALFRRLAEDWNVRDFQGENWRTNPRG